MNRKTPYAGSGFPFVSGANQITIQYWVLKQSFTFTFNYNKPGKVNNLSMPFSLF